MKELDLINVIKEQLGNEYIGDDCAYLPELGIVVSQDSLVEGVHFKREWATPWQIGYKSVAVNISDILASGAKPAYITIALSLPADITGTFVETFYKGAAEALYGAKIIGGDITGADKVYISITAVGTTKGRKISSRRNAKAGYKVITRGVYGLSSAGLEELRNGCSNNTKQKRAHLLPQLDEKFSRSISERITEDYAMMDTSDGLADALYKIAEASGLSIDSKFVEGMFGAEDYNLVAAVPESFLNQIDDHIVIGDVIERQDYVLKIQDKKYCCYDELGLFNHFGGDNE